MYASNDDVACRCPSATYAETVVPTLARQEHHARFRVTAFATGPGYPTSMTRLADRRAGPRAFVMARRKPAPRQ